MASSPILSVGDKLVVGQIDNPVEVLSKLTPGTAVINGPVYVGAGIKPVPTANAMFGPGLFTGLPALESVGITNIFGNYNSFAINQIFGASNFFEISLNNSVSIKNGVDVKNALNLGNAANVFNASLTVNALATAPTIEAGLGVFQAVAAPFKQFNIPHPSKPGHRLVHACLEGPEVGVYHRGRLSNSDIIELPDYWINLVDVNSITVHLTPHKYYQQLYVKCINGISSIEIGNNLDEPIHCDYIIYAERIDIPKLKVEYKETKK